MHGVPLALAPLMATVNLGLFQALEQMLTSLDPALKIGDLQPQITDATEYEAVRDWMSSLHVLFYTPQGRILDVSKL